MMVFITRSDEPLDFTAPEFYLIRFTKLYKMKHRTKVGNNFIRRQQLNINNLLLITLVAISICLSRGDVTQKGLLCLLYDQNDVDCRLKCQDVQPPEVLSRVRRQDCRTCTRESDINCWDVCSFYFGVCLSTCEFRPSTYCVRDCQVEYNRL
ncbi:hypothetical protein Btru_000401 [Bulinus truncatus]|nr:hypothetical protein Btru_000401 [Bulinus truncatus]